MKRSLFLAAWLVILWIALWQDLSFANLLSGVILAAILVLVFPVGRTTDQSFIVRPLPALKFLVFFTWKLIEANAIVAWQVLRPSSGVVEGIVAVELRTASAGIATIVADAVTLTPGTMTIDIRRPPPGGGPIVLFVHVLQLGDPDDIRADTWTFEDMAVAAFGRAPAPVSDADETEERS